MVRNATSIKNPSSLDQSGGKIWFESAENKGAIFYVAIPLKGMEKRKGTKGVFLRLFGYPLLPELTQ